MKLNFTEKPALLLIDIQKGFDDIEYWGGARNNPDAEQKAGQLLAIWREKGLPVFHVKHCSTTPGSRLAEGQEGNDIQDVVKPIGDEPVIKKDVNSAFIGTDLEDRLKKASINQVVIVGLTTDHCVSTSTRMAANLGFETYLVNDATATFDKVGVNGEKYAAQLIHDTAIASLHQEFATIVNTEAIIRALQGTEVIA